MGKKPVCHIVGASDFHGISVKEGDFIIAADGGYRYLKELNIKPDMVIGDFDSLGSIPNGENIVLLPKEKDDTDMGAAAQEGLRRGFSSFALYGATGGRVDHTIANLQLIAKLSQSGAAAVIDGGDTMFTAVTNSKICFDEKACGYVSVFSHTDVSTGVNLKGLKYELRDYDLKNTFSLGVSNEFCGVCSEISVENGTLIVIYPKGVNLK